MKKKILFALAFTCIALISKAQPLDSFSVTLQAGNYLSVSQKKAFTLPEAKTNKRAIDFILFATAEDGKQKLEWYNLSGKNSKIPLELTGSSTAINAISFDREQFAKCNSNEDLKRMTGHITQNSFSHFSVISDDVKQGINYHCFIIQMENGKRALLWVDAIDNNAVKVLSLLNK